MLGLCSLCSMLAVKTKLGFHRARVMQRHAVLAFLTRAKAQKIKKPTRNYTLKDNYKRDGEKGMALVDTLPHCPTALIHYPCTLRIEFVFENYLVSKATHEIIARSVKLS